MPLKFSPISWERLRVGQEFSPAAFYRRSRWWCGGGPAESTAPRGREPFSTEKESTEEEGEGGQKRIRVEGTRFLNSFVRNRYPVPKSASLRDICTREGRRERNRERGRQSDSREYMQNGGLERGEEKKERREEKREAIDTQSFLNEIGKELFYFRSLDR